VLTGDPFYLRRYRKEFDDFAPRLTPAARAALAGLKRKIKDENKNIISAFLCLYFSATDDQTLDDMLRSLNEGERLKRSLQKTAYFNEGGWQLFNSVQEELTTLFLFLKEIHFGDYWERNILPGINQRVTKVEQDLAGYNVVTEIENHLGFALPSNRITIYLLAFAWPHGMRIVGTRFIADISYPLTVILQNAIHEMMHPPYRLDTDRELRDALSKLKADAFLMDKVLNHNPSFGYNSFESVIEEDCVRALEQIITEKLNIGREARKRWKEEDDGMHVFAVVLYGEMKQQSFNQGRGTFRDFLLRALTSGRIRAGKLKFLYEAFYS